LISGHTVSTVRSFGAYRQRVEPASLHSVGASISPRPVSLFPSSFDLFNGLARREHPGARGGLRLLDPEDQILVRISCLSDEEAEPSEPFSNRAPEDRCLQAMPRHQGSPSSWNGDCPTRQSKREARPLVMTIDGQPRDARRPDAHGRRASLVGRPSCRPSCSGRGAAARARPCRPRRQTSPGAQRK
jgi:hypothetical protein